MKRLLCALLAAALSAAPWPGAAAPVRHYASNNNFDSASQFAPARAGFDLADVASPQQLDGLPADVLGFVWIGKCAGADEAFRLEIDKYVSHPKVFGFYLMDDPDPTGRWRPTCPEANLRAQADYIHARIPGARAFIALMNVGTAAAPAFTDRYAPERSHIDLFSVAPYPCRARSRDCDFDMIGRFVEAARGAGYPTARIVPTYQTFGGGQWRPADGGGEYRMPSAAETEAMLRSWSAIIAAPEMDFAYSWGRQRDDQALESAPELQEIFMRHNR
jgi:hypothetical protein